MVLSKRERYIGIGTIGAVVLLGIITLILDPYMNKRQELVNDAATAKQTLKENQRLLDKQQSLQPEWKEMLASGLEADQSNAQSRTQQALQTWARSSNINLESLSSEAAPSQKGPFQIINFNIDFNTSGQESMRQIARLLWSLESASIPIRVNDAKIQSTREGTDQLNVKLIVSALYMPPTGAPAAAPGAGDEADDAGDVQ